MRRITTRPIDPHDDRVKEHVTEVLKMLDSKQRYSGMVSKVDGTTTIIESGERKFLVWSRPELKPDTSVTFRIDGLRAIDVLVEPKQEAIPVESEPTTAIAAAFRQLFK